MDGLCPTFDGHCCCSCRGLDTSRCTRPWWGLVVCPWRSRSEPATCTRTQSMVRWGVGEWRRIAIEGYEVAGGGVPPSPPSGNGCCHGSHLWAMRLGEHRSSKLRLRCDLAFRPFTPPPHTHLQARPPTGPTRRSQPSPFLAPTAPRRAGKASVLDMQSWPSCQVGGVLLDGGCLGGGG